MKLTLETLPAAVSELLVKLNSIEEQLLIRMNERSDIWLSIEELCEYLPGKPAKATIYGYVHNRRIPHQKTGKRLSFLKSQIDSWLHSQSREVLLNETDAADYLKKKGPEQ